MMNEEYTKREIDEKFQSMKNDYNRLIIEKWKEIYKLTNRIVELEKQVQRLLKGGDTEK